MRQNIIVLDFGGQYNQLIARRVRECNVYCEVHPYTLDIETLKQMAPSGIILTGGPNSVYGEDSPQCNPEVFKLGIPVLGICYGAQLLAYQLGGKVATAPVSEYGRTEVTIDDRSGLLEGDRKQHARQYHHVDEPYRLHRKHPAGFQGDCAYAGLSDRCHGKSASRVLCDPVPSGSHAFRGRLSGSAEFRAENLRL